MDLSTLMPQQRDIVKTLDRPLFVSAGAGSGKTFTLTRRILWALSEESGPFAAGMDEVMAITFTRDAAAEIRERVRAALIAEGMDREALSVDDAWISTIHGMCARILRAHALELGLDPEFGVLTDTDDLRAAAVDAALAEAGEDYGELLSWYRLSSGEMSRGTSVRSLVERLLTLASSAPHGLADLKLHRGSIDLSGVRDAYQALLENGNGKGVGIAQAALAAIDAYEQGSSRTQADLLTCLMALDAPRASKGFPAESVAWLKAEVADASVNAYLAASPALEQLMELTQRVVSRYAALKREQSLLDNDDLLRLAYEALRDHSEIRAAYAGRFKLVMIDEFQDTDQQQVDLIGFLTGAGGRALCTVGDAQQSIYRFRGAEVEVFRRQQRRIETADAGAGRVVKLVKNFRSHAQILEYVARVFDDADGGIMPGFLNLDPHEGRRDGLVAATASRRQAILAVGGSEDRTRAAAEGIARRFRSLADAGQPVGGMVVLLGRMSNADVYADAIRAQGLDCVIAGGSVFASLPETKAILALARTLANPADAASGLAPLLASPLFALGAEELLALATTYDPETGETSRRRIEIGLMADEDAPGFGPLPLLDRARTVLRRALARVGRDPFAEIARDVVNESGLFVRLAARGAEGRAQAANVLKALDALEEAEAECGRSPRLIALAFERFLRSKQAPGALNEEGSGAVRIMTVHMSKGLEFPVVAVAECYRIRATADRLQAKRGEDGVMIAALPATYPDVPLAEGEMLPGEEVKKRFAKFLGGQTPWLSAEQVDEVSATGSAAAAWLEMRAEEDRLALEERARLLYVAMTRAREVCILALEGSPTGSAAKLAFNPDRDLTGEVLRRILPGGGASLDVDRLCFDSSVPGDFELISLSDFTYGDQVYQANATEPAPAGMTAASGAGTPQEEPPDSLTLVRPASVAVFLVPATRVRDSYSYTSVAAAYAAAGEDRLERDEARMSDRIAAENAEALPPAADPGAPSEPAPSAPQITDLVMVGAAEPATGSAPSAAVSAGGATSDGEAVALGSAFHAAARWLVETGAETVPPARLDALAALWALTPGQRQRLQGAITRWEASSVRAEARAWPRLRAEVPFYTQGSESLSRFGSFVEGAIDLLATDPADPTHALVVDYKTGGSSGEAPDELREKHRLQAEIYAGVLRRAGVSKVTLKFVRVEVPDRDDPTQPEVVTYRM